MVALDRRGPRPRRGRGRTDARVPRPRREGRARGGPGRKSNATGRRGRTRPHRRDPRRGRRRDRAASTTPSSSPPTGAATTAGTRPPRSSRPPSSAAGPSTRTGSWHIDSMLEAGEKAAKEQLESLQRKAAGGAERIEAHLERGRAAPGPRPRDRAEVEFAGELPAPNDDDPINRMNKARAGGRGRGRAPRAAVLAEAGAAPRARRLRVVAAGLGALVSSPFLDLPQPRSSSPPRPASCSAWRCGCFVRWLGRQSTLAAGKDARAAPRRGGPRPCRLLNDYAAREYAEERARISERHTRKTEGDRRALPAAVRAQKQAVRRRDRADRGGVRRADRQDPAASAPPRRRPRRRRTTRCGRRSSAGSTPN